jgi:hypothetical protein
MAPARIFPLEGSHTHFLNHRCKTATHFSCLNVKYFTSESKVVSEEEGVGGCGAERHMEGRRFAM